MLYVNYTSTEKNLPVQGDTYQDFNLFNFTETHDSCFYSLLINEITSITKKLPNTLSKWPLGDTHGRKVKSVIHIRNTVIHKIGKVCLWCLFNHSLSLNGDLSHTYIWCKV